MRVLTSQSEVILRVLQSCTSTLPDVKTRPWGSTALVDEVETLIVVGYGADMIASQMLARRKRAYHAAMNCGLLDLLFADVTKSPVFKDASFHAACGLLHDLKNGCDVTKESVKQVLRDVIEPSITLGFLKSDNSDVIAIRPYTRRPVMDQQSTQKVIGLYGAIWGAMAFGKSEVGDHE
ncbi:hypothetical protein [Aporhodopirellula aestuarii]|uniref:Uncharacterized protein n=1 Tax=Aporhodopirellula aestuarii TaxID=2950107 RepID=A0ABT0UCN6_9BACT|nr:hypothetical protein [Aporhodopirellula aestuarii]MCM2374658.1 hypothetical protein [Aporhodopirellula aestuarii]